MKVVGLISGGKDSCHNLLWCRVEGHEVVALANLQPSTPGEMDSMMYQSAGHEVVPLLAAALGLPLYRRSTAGRALEQGRVYSARAGDEVEDLAALLRDVRAAQPEVEAVSSGAILSDYQRVRVEDVCARLGLVSLAFLWRRPQPGLLREMTASGLDAILVKVASFGLSPRRHLGRSLRDVGEELIGMADSHALNPCGEGGEFETFVLDSPLCSRRLEVVRQETVQLDDALYAPEASLRLELRLVPKEGPSEEAEAESEALLGGEMLVSDVAEGTQRLEFRPSAGEASDERWRQAAAGAGMAPQDVRELACAAGDFVLEEVRRSEESSAKEEEEEEEEEKEKEKEKEAPHLRTLCCLGEGDEPEAATHGAMARLRAAAGAQGLDFEGALYAWVLVADMAQYAAVNAAYAAAFPAPGPPARACVEAPLPAGRPVLVGLLLAPAAAARRFLHVRSLSHWAPANIGPYSQAVALSPWLFVSGQIAMRPCDLTLLPDMPAGDQAALALRHAQAVVSAVAPQGTSLADVAWGVCFATGAEALREAFRRFHEAVCAAAGCRCERWTGVVVPALPRAAAVEWQPVLGTARARPPRRRLFHDGAAMATAAAEAGPAAWLLCREDAAGALLGAGEGLVVLPVAAVGTDGACVGCLVEM